MVYLYEIFSNMSIIDPKLKEIIPAPLRNKFILLFIGYFIYLLFFSENTLISQAKLAMQVHELSKQENYYATEITKVKKEDKETFSSIENMEKYARENYWMKKDSEDLYIFVEAEK